MSPVRWPSGWRYAIDHRSRFLHRSSTFSSTTPPARDEPARRTRDRRPGSVGRRTILLGRFGQREQSLAFRRQPLAPEPIGSAGQGFDPMPALGADSLVRRPAPDRLLNLRPGLGAERLDIT